MTDLVRVHCPNCGRTSARVFKEDGVEYWETDIKTIPYAKFRRTQYIKCPNFDRDKGLPEVEAGCYTLWIIEPRDVLEKVVEAGVHGLRHMPTGPGVRLSSPLDG